MPPSTPSRLVRRSRLLDSPGPRTTGPPHRWWWARPGRARPPFWPTGWPPTRSDQPRGSAVIPPTPTGVRFVAAIIEALRRACHRPGLGEDARQLLSLDGEVSADVIAALADDLDGLDGPHVLVIDDFHLTGAAGADTLTLLLECRPAVLQLVLASRADPGLRLHQDASQRRAGRVAGPGSGLLRRRDQTLPLRVRSASERAGPQCHPPAQRGMGRRPADGGDLDPALRRPGQQRPVEWSCTATPWPGISSTRSSPANRPSWSSSCWPPRSSTNCRCRPATPCAVRGRPPSSSSSTAAHLFVTRVDDEAVTLSLPPADQGGFAGPASPQRPGG